MGAYAEVVERLVNLGHRRIVNLVREERRKPTPGFLDRFFLEQLRNHGIQTGPYHLPDWEDTPEGLQHLLDSLFQHTPPFPCRSPPPIGLPGHLRALPIDPWPVFPNLSPCCPTS